MGGSPFVLCLAGKQWLGTNGCNFRVGNYDWDKLGKPREAMGSNGWEAMAVTVGLEITIGTSSGNG